MQLIIATLPRKRVGGDGYDRDEPRRDRRAVGGHHLTCDPGTINPAEGGRQSYRVHRATKGRDHGIPNVLLIGVSILAALQTVTPMFHQDCGRRRVGLLLQTAFKSSRSYALSTGRCTLGSNAPAACGLTPARPTLGCSCRCATT